MAQASGHPQTKLLYIHQFVIFVLCQIDGMGDTASSRPTRSGSGSGLQALESGPRPQRGLRVIHHGDDFLDDVEQPPTPCGIRGKLSCLSRD